MNEQLAELFDASVTLKIFVVVPVGKLAALERPAVCVVVCPEQLSVPIGVVKVTFAVQVFVVTLAVIFAGQVIWGSWLSIIVIVKEQLAELFDASVTLKIFVVVPVAKLAPLARPAV